MLSLTASERLSLKGKAHNLNPTIMIGNAGLSPSVLREIAQTLTTHELIKVKVMADRPLREAIMQEICTELNAAPVQHIGKVLVIYLPNSDAHKIAIKKAPRYKGKRPLNKKQLAGRGRS